MVDICDYDCFNCRFSDCLSDLYLGQEQTARERVLKALAAGATLKSPRAQKNQRKWSNDYARKKRDEARAKGLCQRCGEPVTDYNPKTGKKYSLCTTCRARSAAQHRGYYHNALEMPNAD